MLLFERKKDL